MLNNALEKIRLIIKPGESLKWRTVQGTVAVLAGDGYQQVLRLAGNLIMTRMLYPEAFGLMLIVNLFFMALNMLSDAGIHAAVIIKSKGREKEFINTAWTLLVIRGALLTIVGVLLAWPMAEFYNEPILFGLILAASFGSVIKGLASPHGIIYDRDVKKVRIVFLEALAQTLAIVITLAWLYINPTIWALVGNLLLAAAFTSFFSYYVFAGERPHFELNKKIVSEILSFGKWIFLSTAMAFFATQGDKAIISKWISTEELGLFSIAIALAKVTETISGSVNSKLLLPVYSELGRGDSVRASKQEFKARLVLFLICAPFIFIFSLFGDVLVEFMYDPRYHGAGWMLQVIALGTVFTAYNDTMGTVVLSKGKSYEHMWLQAYRSVSLIVVMLLGGYYWGFLGLIYAIALAPALFYPVIALYVRGLGVKRISYDLVSIAFIVSAVFLVWYATAWPNA